MLSVPCWKGILQLRFLVGHSRLERSWWENAGNEHHLRSWTNYLRSWVESWKGPVDHFDGNWQYDSSKSSCVGMTEVWGRTGVPSPPTAELLLEKTSLGAVHEPLGYAGITETSLHLQNSQVHSNSVFGNKEIHIYIPMWIFKTESIDRVSKQKDLGHYWSKLMSANL